MILLGLGLAIAAFGVALRFRAPAKSPVASGSAEGSGRPDGLALAEFWSRSEKSLSHALSHIEGESNRSDSIAVAFYDSLESLADDFYDLYYCDEYVKAQHQNDTSASALDTALALHGFGIRIFDGSRIFRANPLFVSEKFWSNLTEAGKEFFLTRSNDHFLPNLDDEALHFLPYDSLLENLVGWDRFCTAHPGTFAGMRGEAFFGNYLKAYMLPMGKLLRKGDGWGVESAFGKSLDKAIVSQGQTRLGKVLAAYREALLRHGPAVEENFAKVLQWDASKEGYLQPVLGSVTKDGDAAEKDKDRNDTETEIFANSDFPVYVNEIPWQKVPWLALSHLGQQWRLDSIFLVPRRIDSLQKGDDTAKLIVLPKTPGIEFVLHNRTLAGGSKPFIENPGQAISMEKAGINRFSFGKRRLAMHTIAARYSFFADASGPTDHRFSFLEHNGKEVLIAHSIACEGGECRPYQERITWAGDLDGDGNVDFIMAGKDKDLMCDYTRLYLSKSAPPGKNIGFVKEQYATNCNG